jgi:hypothetical protein
MTNGIQQIVALDHIVTPVLKVEDNPVANDVTNGEHSAGRAS